MPGAVAQVIEAPEVVAAWAGVDRSADGHTVLALVFGLGCAVGLVRLSGPTAVVARLDAVGADVPDTDDLAARGQVERRFFLG
ncbi:hypothetical protein ABFW14_29115 [Mycolicibacterium fortuitum]|uniref:hypothetical protein n=1 Tax=Mycolicibacterium fortuitum TaxID=1766 RepID=UPI0007ED125E|nr:hypothetical protein [Mycolicibacterium fortuitum]OBK02762.1 hypothetical protein A5637_16220 [Mycolicibacterium fortuitum]